MSTSVSAAAVASAILGQLRKRYPDKDPKKLEGFAKVIEQHEEKQGEPVAWIVTGNDILLVFRRPTQDEWEDAGSRMKRDPVPVVNRQLALDAVLEPKPDDMPAIFKRWPGLHARIADALTVLVGADEELIVKKD